MNYFVGIYIDSYNGHGNTFSLSSRKTASSSPYSSWNDNFFGYLG